MKKKLQYKKHLVMAVLSFCVKKTNFIFHIVIMQYVIDDNSANVTNNIYNFSDIKQKLIEYLNLHHLITFEKFKLYAAKLFLKGEFVFIVRKNTFGNIFTLGEELQKFLTGIQYLTIIKLLMEIYI